MGPPHCFVLCHVGDSGKIVIFAIFAKFVIMFAFLPFLLLRAFLDILGAVLLFTNEYKALPKNYGDHSYLCFSMFNNDFLSQLFH